ncbi:NADAR family protein [Paenibacillus foliorum]|nr:NADAR family protein [Paenibacillus foliorum]
MNIPDNIQKMIEENRKKMKKLKPEERFIRFYETNKPYGCFSNFAKYPVTLINKEWVTTEHYFQAQKFVGTEYEEEVRLAITPMEATRLGRDRNKPLRKDWEDCKVQIMREALIAKVEQHPRIKSILLSTGDCTIVEHTTNDAYWGDGGNGQGQNMLGKLLMEIRNGLDGYAPEFFLPQWVAFPDIHPFSIGWRMGAGEDYLMYLWEWRKKQLPEAIKEYDEYFTPPEQWVEASKVREAHKNRIQDEK